MNTESMSMRNGRDLLEILQLEIKYSTHQAISFKRFMEMCLYHDEFGYYVKRKIKVGKEGDFYTSSSIGSIMGEMLASYYSQIIKERFAKKGIVQLVEWGGGNGQLAKHILDEMREVVPEVYERIQYICIEESDFHKELQADVLFQHKECIRWLSEDEWFEQGDRVETIIFSNELLDAFSVHRIIYKHSTYYEIFVEWNEELQQFAEKLIPIKKGPLLQYINEEGIVLIEGQKAEINLSAIHWIERIGKWLEKGVLVTIDYGDESEEIYGPHRLNGTLMCYRNHKAYDNPYIFIGDQDMTSHVNFSACIHAGVKVGFDEWSLVDQKTFLVQAGIMEKLQEHGLSDPFHPMAKKNRAIRQILWSDQMSELFKVLVQKK